MSVIVLMSGGPDSSTLAFHAKHQLGEDVIGLFVDSGQLFADAELAGAKTVAKALGIHLEIARLSAFRDVMIGFVPAPYVAMGGDAEALSRGGAFLPIAVACSYAVFTQSSRIQVATIAEDVEKFPAMIPFVENWNPNLRLFLSDENAGIELPFLRKRKSEVLRLGTELGVPLHATRTCQQATALHCGECSRCSSRHQAFRAAGLADPTAYTVAPGAN
ncbi:7-cyano-7-deazaguanine synthase [Cryobacterium sp. BB307]|uniref:7-cyano-7-deazaguanine synthase n=1 Tax=Cryobacterium sp. BB307 TaxID=2716317 RepID=UPI001447E417|nr:7-cyano-7-deazaguanine synthase [Cryobacterium sp. BB307]